MVVYAGTAGSPEYSKTIEIIERMKIRNPKSRFHIDVKRSDYVLDVGGGHNPHPRANVVVDETTVHQCRR